MNYDQKVEEILSMHKNVFDSMKKNTLGLIVVACLALGALIGFFITFIGMEKENKSYIAFAVILFITGIILFILSFSRGKQNKIIKNSLSLDGQLDELYSLYFSEHFSQTGLKFVETKSGHQTSSIYFLTNKSKLISFTTNYNIRYITVHTKNTTTTKTVYDIYYNFERPLANYQNYGAIKIVGDTAFRLNNSSFQTESITFNKNYIVKTKDEMNYRRFFTPSMIQNFLDADIKFFQRNETKIENANLYSNGKVIEASTPVNMLLRIQIGSSLQKTKINLAKSIDKDLTFFLSYYESTKFIK